MALRTLLKGITTIAALAMALPGGVASAADAGWQSMGTKDGISVSRKEVPGSPIIAFHGEGDINAPLIQCATVVLDDDRGPEWVDSLVEAKVVRVINPLEYIEFNHIGTPPLIRDRDFVTDVKMTVDPVAKSFTVKYQSVDEPLMPPGKWVRGEMMYTYFVLTSIDNGTRTHISCELFADPKGWLPKWLVNLFQQDWPINTIQGLRKQSAKKDIKRPAVFTEVLRQVEAVTH